MLLRPFKSSTSMWNGLNSFQHCSLQTDELEPLTWLMGKGSAPAAYTNASVVNEALSPSEQSQESQYLRAPSLSSFFNGPTVESSSATSQCSSSEIEVPNENLSDCPATESDGQLETRALENTLLSHVRFPQVASPSSLN